MNREDKVYIDLDKLGCSEENESLSIHESYEDIEITEEDLEDYLANDKYSKKLNRPTSTGPMVLLRNGNIYDISSYETHPSFAGAVGGYFGYEHDEDEFEDYDSDFLDYLEEYLGVITLNPGDHAFEECENLTHVTIPDSVTKIGNLAFGGCCNLERINIPDSVTEICRQAFYRCYTLESINIPNGVTKIAYDTFGNCENLTSIIIPDGVCKIEELAFDDCFELKSIVIPDSVTEISDQAFDNCVSLTDITYKGIKYSNIDSFYEAFNA